MAKTMSGATQRMNSHFVRSGVSTRDSRRLTSTIQKWIEKSGLEWTTKRLKGMKVYTIQREAGNDEKPSWVKLHSDGSFHGPFRCLKTLSFKQQLSVLNAYTALVLKEPTKGQIKDTFAAIGNGPTDPVKVSKSCANMITLIKKSGFIQICRERVKPSYDILRPGGLNTANPGTLLGGDWVNSFIQGLHNPYVGDFLEDKFGMEPKLFAFTPLHDDIAALSPGRIALIQERGAKARVVAMPNSALQSALLPLHKGINRCLRSLSTDCTHHQEEGALFAQRCLLNGQSVYSVDLSSATDRFPRELQCNLLREIGLGLEARLIESASSSPWLMPEEMSPGGRVTYLKYGTGQPMGLYSSFALFALTHNACLHAMCAELGLKPKNSFRVLGDDVIIGNDALHQSYRTFLKGSEVPVSVTKTLESSKLAEFAGFLIHKDQGIFKIPKIPTVDGRNFIAYLRAFGHSAIKDLPAKVRKTATAFAELPTELGGLGYNPRGKTLEQRCSVFRFEEKLMTIPGFTSVVPNLLRSRMDWTGEPEAEVVDFLYDQYKLYADSFLTTESLPQNLEKLVKIQSQRFQLQQQLALASEPDAKTSMIWNTHATSHKMSSNHSDLDVWEKKLDTSVPLTPAAKVSVSPISTDSMDEYNSIPLSAADKLKQIEKPKANPMPKPPTPKTRDDEFTP